MYNSIAIMGRLVRDPQVRVLEAGTTVCNITLAVDDDFRGREGEKETDFIDCTLWRAQAEFASKYLHKGDMTLIRGRLKSRKWVDKDGNNRVNWFINGDAVYSAGGRKEAAERSMEPTQPKYMAAAQLPVPIEGDASDFALLDDDDGQLPF